MIPNTHTLDVSDANFETEVIQRSQEIPVLVDFWAEWCAPCRMLGPVLEQLAVEYGGKFLLAKANLDQTAQAAAGFAVQSIPAVFALRDGKVVDQFLGVMPEPELRLWLDRILPSKAEGLAREADQLAQSDAVAAEEKYRLAMAADMNLAEAKIGLANLLLEQDREDETRQIIEELEKRGYLEPEAEKIKAALHLRKHAQSTGSVESCRTAAKGKPEDLGLQFELAEALAGSRQFEEALEISLHLVRADRQQFGESARQLMIDIFRLLPDDSELTTNYRRKLSAALY